MIKEVIVVEGKDDIDAVKKAIDADLIATGGFGFPKGVEERIIEASKKRGIIIFTDPDHAGEKIRLRVSKLVKNAKHAFLPREEAMNKKGDNIGIENASKESILNALSKVRYEKITVKKEFSKTDLIKNKLIMFDESSNRRDLLGNILGIGYGNAKQFLIRLNNYGVTRVEFEEGIIEMKKRLGE